MTEEQREVDTQTASDNADDLSVALNNLADVIAALELAKMYERQNAVREMFGGEL